jgi:hypothetical protein
MIVESAMPSAACVSVMAPIVVLKVKSVALVAWKGERTAEVMKSRMIAVALFVTEIQKVQ